MATLVTASALALGACSDADPGPPVQASSAVTDVTEPRSVGAGISEDEAIGIAAAAWSKEQPDFDVDAHRAIVHEAPDTFDISFVPVDLTGNTGEPHVVIDRETGAVTEMYRTK